MAGKATVTIEFNGIRYVMHDAVASLDLRGGSFEDTSGTDRMRTFIGTGYDAKLSASAATVERIDDLAELRKLRDIICR